MQDATPTNQTYTELQAAFDWFNERLFDSALPDCLITYQREPKSCGYFSARRWTSMTGVTTDEIAMNPSYFAVNPVEEILATMVHEMTHLWQHHFGKPGRRRYHNQEWADKMKAIGLYPSSTGRPGGKETGERMADYIVENGPFHKACKGLLETQFVLTWLDRFPPRDILTAVKGNQRPPVRIFPYPSAETTKDNDAVVEDGDGIAPEPTAVSVVSMPPAATPGIDFVGHGSAAGKPTKSTRSKYRCPTCQASVWGKPQLHVICGACRVDMADTTSAQQQPAPDVLDAAGEPLDV